MSGLSDFTPGGDGVTALRTLLPLVAVGLILALRNRQARPLRLERLWLRPLMSALIVGYVLYALPPPLTPVSLLIMSAGLIIGVAVGWQRGRFMRLEVHPETRAVMAKMSSLGMLFVLAVIGLRMWLATTLRGAPVAGISAATVTDSLMILAGVMMLTQQVEITLRARRLLAEAQTTALADVP
jgi:hypothetical protein